MTPRITNKIPQHLVEMATVKYGAPRSADLKGEHFRRHFFVGTKITHEMFEVELCVDRFGVGAVATIQVQDLLHHPVQPMRIVLDDREQPLIFRTTIAHFVQQFRRMINA